MKPTEIKDLVTGLLVLIMAAIALGQYGKLEHFARAEAANALRPNPTRPFFEQSLTKRLYHQQNLDQNIE